MKIGFIGLGIMGKPMAKNLIRAGYDLTVYNRSKEPVEELVKEGAEAGKNAKDVAEKSDVIITMLPDSPDVEEVVLGRGGVVEGISSGKVLMDMSSIKPSTAKKIAEELGEKGCDVLDAPVSGGEPKAVEGTLAIMVGGKKEVFGKCKGILEKMGSSVTLVGNNSAGQSAKLANQIIVALNIEAMGEALVLGRKAGVDPEVLYNSIKGGLAGSSVLDAKAKMVYERDFKPGFKIKLHLKDINNALETAKELGLKLPNAEKVKEMLQKLVDEGKGDLDHSAIVQYIEKLNGLEVKK